MNKRRRIVRTAIVAIGTTGLLYLFILVLGPEARLVEDPDRDVSTTMPLSTGAPTERYVETGYARSPVNVRFGPGTSHPVVSQLAAGDQALTGRPDDSGWAVLYVMGDTVGYVLTSLLAESPPTRPVVKATANRPQQIALRVSAFNMGDGRVSGRTEVWLRGQGSWYPDLQYDGDVTTFEGRTVGTVDSVYFYPHGRGGPVLMAPVHIGAEFCPQGCPRDMLNFEVWDDRYVAWGAGVEGHEIALKRR